MTPTSAAAANASDTTVTSAERRIDDHKRATTAKPAGHRERRRPGLCRTMAVRAHPRRDPEQRERADPAEVQQAAADVGLVHVWYAYTESVTAQ